MRARLLTLAQRKGTDFQLMLTRYALERFLYRLSVSRYGNRFILKGAMLLTIWLDDPFRPTRDLDLLGFGDSEIVEIEAIFREICGGEVPDDGAIFDAADLRAEPIRDDTEYGGVRVQTRAMIAGAHVSIRIDIGFGDAVTPGPAEIDYPVLLDAPTPRLRTYPKETVIAEKFEAVVALGFTNSRMKDFYDLWMMTRHFDFDGKALAAAIRATFDRRGTEIPSHTPIGLSEAFAVAPEKMTQWLAFIRRDRLGADAETLAEVIAKLRDFLLPVALVARDDSTLPQTWPPGGPWQ